MSKIIGKLRAREGTSYVTFKEAKQQIRDLAKACDLKLGSFRPRSADRTSLQVTLADGSGVVTAKRKPGEDVLVVETVQAADIDPQVLEKVLEDGADWQPESL